MKWLGMKVNDKETFQGDHLGANLGTGHALTIYDQTPNEANSSNNKKHLDLNTKVKPETRERLWTFNALTFNLRELRKFKFIEKDPIEI